MKRNLWSMALMVGLLASASAWAGRETGNGGFAFSQSSAAKILKFAAAELDERLGWRDEACVNQQLAGRGLKPVDLAKLRSIIKNVRKNYLSSAKGVNAEGDVEPLLFDYGSDEKGPYIEAQQVYFVSYLAAEFPNARNQNAVAEMLLHEASHHFGYNDTEATAFASQMRRISDSTSACLP